MIQFGANFSTLGVPEAGLSPIITIHDTSDGSIIINGSAMTEVGNGAYKYDFTNDVAKKYSAVMDGGVDTLDSRYMAAWSERAKSEAEIAEIKDRTDKMNFTGDDIKATLDGEEVITDTASRNASKADISGIPTNPLLSNDARILAIGNNVTDIHDESFGEWEIDSVANTLTLYTVGGDILKIFDLNSTSETVPAYIRRVPR